MNDSLLLGSGLGVLIGVILALTGAGGGILAVPLLVFVLGLSMVQAAPIGLLAVGLAAAVGALLGLRQGIVRYRAAGFIAGIGILLTPVGLWEPLALGFALLMLYACVRIFKKAQHELKHGQPVPRAAFLPCVLNPSQGRLRWTLPCARALTVTGMLSGLLSGLLGVLTRYTNLDSKSIVATSLAVIALVSTGSVVTATLSGVMHWSVGVPFAGGAVVGLVLGRQLAGRLAGPRLQQLFALTGLLAALMLALNALGLTGHT